MTLKNCLFLFDHIASHRYYQSRVSSKSTNWFLCLFVQYSKFLTTELKHQHELHWSTRQKPSKKQDTANCCPQHNLKWVLHFWNLPTSWNPHNYNHKTTHNWLSNYMLHSSTFIINTYIYRHEIFQTLWVTAESQEPSVSSGSRLHACAATAVATAALGLAGKRAKKTSLVQMAAEERWVKCIFHIIFFFFMCVFDVFVMWRCCCCHCFAWWFGWKI